MSFMKNLFRAKEKPASPIVPAESGAVSDTYLAKVWELEDPFEILSAVRDRIDQKSDFGARMDGLSPEEQVICICNLVEMEVNNGGFDQFLFNISGNYAHRAEECLRIVGADKTADICRKAFAAYGKPIPQDRAKRQRFMERMECDRITDILDECDGQFYEYPDDLEALYYQYILAHKDSFT